MSLANNIFLNETEEEIAVILEEIGLKKTIARVLVLFLRGKDVTSREIERGSDLRQPEVSLALNELIKRGWVQIISHLFENKGRPVKLYKLGTTVDAILGELKEQVQESYYKQIDVIEQLRDLVKMNGDN